MTAACVAALPALTTATHAGSAQAWFHLMELLLPTLEGAQQAPSLAPDALAAALDDFVQASTLGQCAQRLHMLATFRCALLSQSAQAQGWVVPMTLQPV